jgi:hypothetical protein
MKMFRGLNHTDYEDVLRVIGRMLDERGYTNFRLVEHEDGIIVQVMPLVDGQHAPTYETFLVTDEDLTALLHTAYQQRNAENGGQRGTTGPLR